MRKKIACVLDGVGYSWVKLSTHSPNSLTLPLCNHHVTHDATTRRHSLVFAGARQMLAAHASHLDAVSRSPPLARLVGMLRGIKPGALDMTAVVTGEAGAQREEEEEEEKEG